MATLQPAGRPVLLNRLIFPPTMGCDFTYIRASWSLAAMTMLYKTRVTTTSNIDEGKGLPIARSYLAEFPRLHALPHPSNPIRSSLCLGTRLCTHFNSRETFTGVERGSSSSGNLCLSVTLTTNAFTRLISGVSIVPGYIVPVPY